VCFASLSIYLRALADFIRGQTEVNSLPMQSNIMNASFVLSFDSSRLEYRARRRRILFNNQRERESANLLNPVGFEARLSE